MSNTEEKDYICNTLTEASKVSIFNEIFKDIQGYEISSIERQKVTENNKSYTYGEVTYQGLKEILDIVNPNEGAQFMDLGSGTGKAVISSALISPFSYVHGIELFKGLYTTSLQIKDEFINKLNTFNNGFKLPKYSIINDSINNCDLSDIDVVLANSTCFDSDLINTISQKAEQLKIGSKFITFTKSLNSNSFNVIHKEYHKMGWGSPTVYIHEKIT